MIKFYTNKELSQIFDINLAKWKRWSREFLPPDPLGGLQSGYARQYNLDEAFTVYLGGYLVSELKFTIPESRQILLDLHQWLIDHGFYYDFSGQAGFETKTGEPVQRYHIAVISPVVPDTGTPNLAYRIKAIIGRSKKENDGRLLHQEQFIQTLIPDRIDGTEILDAESFRVLNISLIRRNFLASFNLKSGGI